MRQIVVPRPGEVVLAEVESPALPDNGFIVRAVQTGISTGTERMWYMGTNPGVKSGRRGYPYRPGYEHVGIVAEASPNCGVSEGDLVFAMVPHAEEAAVSPNDFWCQLPSDFDLDAALLISLVTTALHTVHRSRMVIGDLVVVLGAGVVGLTTAQVARIAGAERVVVISRSTAHHEQARAVGVDTCIDVEGGDIAERLDAALGGRLADVVFECSGEPSAAPVALAATRSGGRLVVEGFHTEPFALDGEQLFAKELEVVGVRSGGGPTLPDEYLRWNRSANFGLACRLVLAGRVCGPGFITHRFAATDVGAAYDLLSCREEPSLHIVLDW